MEVSSGENHPGEDHADDSRFPTNPDFYRSVLYYMPTPIVVVNDQGEIVYGNRALLALGGWELTPDVVLDIMSYIHPEDRDGLVQAFAEIVESPGARVLGGRPWAEIFFRIVNSEGATIPIELVGSGGLLDPAVEGIIYEVRPAHTRDLLGRVLDGLSRGASMLQLLSLVSEIIASPPLDLDAAILQSTTDGDLVLAASTSLTLSNLLSGSQVGTPWEHLRRDPQRVVPADLPEAMQERLHASDFQELWHLSVESPLTANTLRIVAASRTHHVPATGPKNRLVRAQELAAAVLLRTQADVLLAHAADHDALTDLPNRAAFYQLTDGLDPMTDRAAVLLDLDGMKTINDTHGPGCGDAVLRIVADRLRVTASETDIIGRIGDDEFAILLGPAIDDEPMMDKALQLATEILDAVCDPIVVAGRPLHIAASIGIAAAPPSVSTDHLMTWADAAMHDAKAAGGGRIKRFGVAFG